MSTNGESPAPEAAGDSRDPSGFLSEIIGAPVTVKLNSGIIYKGAPPCALNVSQLLISI
jgi:U6 snRNA-associated Sm-like protein LSm6